MKKETLQQIFTRSLTKDAMDLIFVKPKEVEKPTIYTTEQQMLFLNNSFNIKVQSVALPNGFICLDKTEVEILDWLQNKIHSEHNANYKERLKYDIKQRVKLKYQSE